MIPEIENIRITPDNLDKFIKRIENMIRTGPEYKQYLKYIYEDCQIRNCDYFTEWNIEEDLTFELHHIIPLYNLVQIAAFKLLSNNDYVYTFDIAKEVILMHFDNLIPTVILTKTIHQALHAGLYEIKSDSKSLNIGNYRKFIHDYGRFISKKDLSIYSRFIPDYSQLLQSWEDLNG
nr:MAG TPA: hypothetical protein [Caudoviricetes sp.]